jgi:hypothetical protein
MIVYNPAKGRLETLAVELTPENTTWFDHYLAPEDIAMLIDFDGDLLVCENSRNYPVRIPDSSRAAIGYQPKKARELRRRFLE